MKKIEISRNDLKTNLEIIRKIANQNGKDDKGNCVKIIAVVKGNGLGLDLISYAKFLISQGITCLAVANTEEAIMLRQQGITEEILMLSPTCIKKELQLLIEHDITLTLGSLDDIMFIEGLLEKSSKKKTIKAHLKIDTGFGRYGFLYTEEMVIIEAFKQCKNIEITGTYTHFSKPNDEKWTNKQFNRFLKVIAKIKEEGFDAGILHCCASTAFLKYPIMHLNAVRIGSAIQGRIIGKQMNLKKIGTFKTAISEIKTLPAGYTISYGNTYKTKKKTKIAIIPVGYMDGLNRNKLRDDFSFKNNILAVLREIKKLMKDNALKVIIQDKAYRIIGRIGMYHAIIDITGNETIKIGDIVTLDISPMQAGSEIRREYI